MKKFMRIIIISWAAACSIGMAMAPTSAIKAGSQDTVIGNDWPQSPHRDGINSSQLPKFPDSFQAVDTLTAFASAFPNEIAEHAGSKDNSSNSMQTYATSFAETPQEAAA